MLQIAPAPRRPLGALAGRWRGLPVAERVLVGLVLAVVAMRVLLYVGVAGAPLVGDESYYLDSAKALSNVVRDAAGGHGPDTAELSRSVVGSGWFMPGMSVVLAPLYVVFPEAPMMLVRGYLGVFSTLLLLGTVLSVRRTLGRLPAGAMLVLPGLVPMYALFGLAAWGDQAAGLLVVLLLCRLMTMLRRMRAGEIVTWRSGAMLGLLGIGAVYLRSSVSVLVVAMLGAALLVAVLATRREARRRVPIVFGAAGLAFVAVLLPWTLSASHVLGGRVVTTTSVPTVMANTFGDRDQVCFGPCDPGSTIWFSPLRYSREVARATGVSEVEVQRQMSQYARADVTPTSYSRDVVVNLGHYVGEPGSFARLIIWPDGPYDVALVALIGTDLLVYPAFLLGIALLLMVVRGPVESQAQSLLLKLAIGALLVQPFVHICGARYWTTLAPLLGLGAALLISERRARRQGDAERGGPMWLTRMQQALAAAAVVVATTVAVLAVVSL